jgi:NAD(P)-dependent dehydrogenase (short-subunit alcohol dehydrogenase family)
MKVYCSGNRRGIGRATCDLFEANGHETIGLNRPDCDLSVSIDPFVKDDFDVYINNAHCDWKQVDLLYALWEKNKDRECIIFNISSGLADVTHNKVFRYPIYKKALDDASFQLQNIPSLCRVVVIKPGLIDTGRVPINGRPTLPVEFTAQTMYDIATAPSNIYYRLVTTKPRQA